MNTKTLLLIILLIVVLAACSFLGYSALQQTLKPNTGITSSSKSVSISKSSLSISSQSASLSSSSQSSNSSSASSANSTNSSSKSSSNSSMTSKSSSSSVMSSSTSSVSSGQVRVYFTQNNSTVGSVLRNSTNTDPLDRVVDAMSTKLKGPTADEIALGFKKDIIMSGTANCYDSAGNLLKDSAGNAYIWTLSQKGTKVYVRFCKPVTLGGSVSDGLLEQSIKNTVTDIISGSTVVILNSENKCLFDASGLNQCGQ